MIIRRGRIIVYGEPVFVVNARLRVVDGHGWTAPCRSIVIAPGDEDPGAGAVRLVVGNAGHVDTPVVAGQDDRVALAVEVGGDARYLELSGPGRAAVGRGVNPHLFV